MSHFYVSGHKSQSLASKFLKFSRNINNLFLYPSGSQPGCRGALGCHLQCPGVPRANAFFYHIIKNTISNCHQTSKQIAMGAVNYYSFL